MPNFIREVPCLDQYVCQRLPYTLRGGYPDVPVSFSSYLRVTQQKGFWCWVVGKNYHYEVAMVTSDTVRLNPNALSEDKRVIIEIVNAYETQFEREITIVE